MSSFKPLFVALLLFNVLIAADSEDANHHHHAHDHHHHKEENHDCTEHNASWQELFIPASKREAFWQSVLSTVFIGCAPILCIQFVSTNDIYLKLLLSFAAGGLMGDVFLHLLPSALTLYGDIEEHDHDHHEHHDNESADLHHGHSHNEGAALLGMHILHGFALFFVLEKLFHEIGGHSHSEHGNHGSNDEHQCRESEDQSAARKHAVTVLSVIGDASHNFTDGLTVAASYLVSKEMGMIQSISILLHEIPHEIGDYAILIENGVSFKMAMLIQFGTAMGCLMGTISAFVLEETQFGTRWIIPFTAGGFIYISCVQVMPTLVAKQFGKIQSVLHIAAFGLGVALMALVGFVEENAENLLSP